MYLCSVCNAVFDYIDSTIPNGTELGAVSFVFCSVIFFSMLILKKMMEAKTRTRLNRIEVELSKIDPKAEFKRSTLLTREKNQLRKKLIPFQLNLYSDLIIYFVIPLLLYKKDVCDFPEGFWLPIKGYVSIEREKGIVKIWFCYYWTLLAKSLEKLIKYLDETV